VSRRSGVVAGLVVVVLACALAGCASGSTSRDVAMPGLELAASADAAAVWEPGAVAAPGTYEVIMTGARVRGARWGEDEFGEPALEIQLDEDGARRLEEWTAANVDSQLLFILDGTVISAPVVVRTIDDGHLQMSPRDEITRDRLDGAMVPRG